MLTRQIRADWMKARSGRALLTLLVVGLLICGLSNLGLATIGGDELEAGTTTAAALSHDLMLNAFALSLFAAIAGAMIVTAEYRTGFIGRTLLLRPQRDVVLASQTVVAAAVGAGFGVVAVLLGLVSGLWGVPAAGQAYVLDGETWLIALGVLVVNVASAMWGGFLGWVIRNQVVSVIAVIVTFLLVEPALQSFAPVVGKFTPVNAMGAVYGDLNPDLLGPLAGWAVMLGWLAVGAAVARRLLVSRDAY